MRTAFAAVSLAVAVTLTGCASQTHIKPVAASTIHFAGIVGTARRGDAGQGVTTVSGRLVTRGQGWVSAHLPLVREGYSHVGDPDSRDGYVLDALEKNTGSVKAFLWTTPNGTAVQWTHLDAPGELRNNSFAAISPDGRWFISGEWGAAETRLLVFAMPGDRSQDIPLATTITLSRPLGYVQGCDFANATTLYCTPSDNGHPQLARVTLAKPLDGHADPAVVGPIVAVPDAGDCVGGESEIEGLDVTGTVVTVAVNADTNCYPMTMLYRYELP